MKDPYDTRTDAGAVNSAESPSAPNVAESVLWRDYLTSILSKPIVRLGNEYAYRQVEWEETSSRNQRGLDMETGNPDGRSQDATNVTLSTAKQAGGSSEMMR